MRANANLVIQGTTCLLVPYRPEHVPQYHEWMKDPYLQQMTASEPLTLDEEYEMQASWREDEGKVTFILLDPTQPDTPGTGAHGGRMAGDVNLYLNDPDDPHMGEIEVMVAEESSRRKGIAAEAVQLMSAYAVQNLGITRFRAKVLEHNTPSLALFQGKLGYQEVRRVPVFKEVWLEKELEASKGTPAGEQYQSMRLQCTQYDQ